MNPLIASPPATPSEPRPEELPIELEEVEARQSGPKTTIKTNMVAQEVRVKATGARLGKSEDERELFTEETTSVLIGENGGVVRLSAAVAPGQLLFLTNEESKREVVAQVKRKRTYKPTSCYVELEFAEPAQRFWGREFSAAAALLPKNAQDAETAALVMLAEATADEPDKPPAAPTAEEVQALRREVEALREQAKLMQTPAANEQTAALATVPAGVPDALPAPATGDVPNAESISNARSEEAPDVPFVPQSTPIEHYPDAAQLTAGQQAALPMPARNFTVPRPKRKRSPRARGSFTPGFREGALRLALLSAALVITAIGAAWYKHWIPWKSAENKPSVSTPASPVNAETSTAPGSQEAAKANSDSGKTKVVSEARVSSRGTSPRSAARPNQPAPETSDAAEASAQISDSRGVVVQPPKPRAPASTTLASKRSTIPAAANAASDIAAPSEAEGIVVPPKLIKSVRPVASMDAVRDFETGNVVIDALVGTAGEVASMDVLSGPPSLRGAAVEALKKYRYEPATRNGQPVPAHVTVTIRFQFEP
jgi:TonB family protein